MALWGRPARWRAAVIAVAFGALVVRLLIIAHSRGGQDLRMYTYFSRLPLHGVNPFGSPRGGLFPPVDGNNPPLEIAVFAGLLAIHDSPTTLRLLFAFADVAVVLLIGLRFPRPRRWRAAFIVFYAFNPFVLFAWTAFAEDKTLLFLGIAAWVLALERDREWGSWAAASALTVFKFLGAFAVPVLALHWLRTRHRRALAPIAAFVAIFLASNLAWFPESLDVFTRRNTRLAIDPPIHASPTILLARLGVYAPIEAQLLTAAALVAIFACFVARRIDVRDAVVWSLFAGYVFLPDDAFNRLLLITLPFMLILHYSIARWVAIWIVSSVAALAGVTATRGVPHVLATFAGPLRAVFTNEATVPHVIWMNLLPALVVTFHFLDRRRAGVSTGYSPPTPGHPSRLSSAPSRQHG
ncbi:MAG: hypothetical protein M3Y09_04185, partial [Actinomycetota bacterium]|nr:hypothetical protein [Actinomycetota bacterium]